LGALGDRQRRKTEYAPISDFRALSRVAVMQIAVLPAMIAVGVDTGYLEENKSGAVGLTSKGLRWYLRDLERHN